MSKWCNRRSSEEALSVLKEWVELHNKPMKVMHDGGKEFTSNKFKNFLILNGIKDKQIPKVLFGGKERINDLKQQLSSLVSNAVGYPEKQADYAVQILKAIVSSND